MPTVNKKHHPSGEKRRLMWLLGAVALLGALVLAASLLHRDEPVDNADPVATSVTLCEYATSDLVSVTIRRGDEEAWTAIPTAEESMTILGDYGFTLTWEESADFLLSAACITAEEVLSDDPAEYADHLADYGLEDPRYEARIVYADSTDVTLRVGDKGHDGAWRYMLIDGDDRLFAFSNGSVEGLFVNRDTLRKVSQPALHKARIDRLTLTEGDSVTQWVLDGNITDSDAIDKWRITSPFPYPADAAAMDDLLSSAASLHLSAYVAPATEENLARYGFDAPRLTIDIHLAAGTIATTNTDGVAEATAYPESTVTFVIGGKKSDMIDYVLCDGDIYLSSHFTTGVFMGYDAVATMSRYPVLTALGNLAALAITADGATTEYRLTRTEQVAENNDLVTDEDGNVVYDVVVTCNGEAMDYAAFEAAYNALTLVTVSGTLPAGQIATAAPHTTYAFTDVDGTVHTVELATFDVLHDAVIVDGHQAFYLIKGGFRLNLD